MTKTDNRYGYQRGDLLRWTNYIQGKSYVGLYLRPVDYAPTGGNDIVVLVGDEQVVWNGWQCEKLNKGEEA